MLATVVGAKEMAEGEDPSTLQVRALICCFCLLIIMIIVIGHACGLGRWQGESERERERETERDREREVICQYLHPYRFESCT